MTGSAPAIRPETHALNALIRETIAQLEAARSESPVDAMLFLGAWHQAFPALLVQDPVLEPVDKVTWMVIRQRAQETGRNTAFPGYSEIARKANVASTSTVSRAIAVLRVTRWLSLCARVRDPGGRFRGNVYALHDEPLPLADALHLDPDYMAFLRESLQHHHARVHAVAQGVIDSIDQDIEAGQDVCAPVSPMERRLDAVKALNRQGALRYFSFNAKAMARLRNAPGAGDDQDQDQNSKPVEERTRPPILDPPKSKLVPPDPGLIYPKRLTANQRELAARYLAAIPAPQRQAVLDELEGRLRAEQYGAKPVYDELRYLHHLCTKVNGGGFQANLGLKVGQERSRRQREAEQRTASAKRDEHGSRRPQPRGPAAEASLETLRKSLGLPASSRPETPSK